MLKSFTTGRDRGEEAPRGQLLWQKATQATPATGFPAFNADRMRAAALVAGPGQALASASIKRCRFGGVDIAKVATKEAGHVRARDLATGGRDVLIAVLCLEGGLLCTQGEAPSRIGPGEGIILDGAEDGGLETQAETRYWALTLARCDLARMLSHICRFAGLRLSQPAMALRLLASYLEGLQAGDALGNEQEGRIFGEHLIDLISMAIGAERDRQQLAERRGVRVLRHAAVMREIERSISDNRLSAAAVAGKLNVTPRYVHFLLEESGLTFSEHVLARRLAAVEAVLRDPQRSNLKISAIAREAGFTDMSYFNRSFRKRFNDTPSGFRGRALGKAEADNEVPKAAALGA